MSIFVWPSDQIKFKKKHVLLCVCEFVGVSEDMLLYWSASDEWLIMKRCMYVGYHDANNV